jgi:hypothetical protein
MTSAALIEFGEVVTEVIDEANAAHVARAVELARDAGAEAACRHLEAQSDPVTVVDQYAKAVRSLYNDHKDVSKMLALGQAGVDYALRKAQELEVSDAAKSKTLKEMAKAIAFNSGANAWPGWDDQGITITEQHLVGGLELAEASKRLVQELGLGPKQVGKAYWLIGAHHLAAGRLSDAAAAFDRAAEGFKAVGDIASQNMLDGYRALAKKLSHATRVEGARELREAYAKLDEAGSAAAKFYRDQISTADRVFSKST